MDQRTRKLITMHKALHPRSDIDRLYVSRKEEGRGLASTEESVNALTWRLEDNTKKSKERLIIANRKKKHKQQKDHQNYNNKKTKMGTKTTVWIFQATNKQNFTREDMDMAKKRKPRERSWISFKNSTKQPHDYVKAKIDQTQQNSKCRLSGERDETIYHIISECWKLAQKVYLTRYNWVGEVIHWKLSEELKLDHMNKCYRHSPESVLENETHNALWDFEIQTDHLISARRLELVRVNKRKKKKKKENLPNSGLRISGKPQRENQRKRKEREISRLRSRTKRKYGIWRWRRYQS